MASLFGKGIWLDHSYNFQRAVEMATKIEATHLLVKVGHGPHYFPTTARKLLSDVRSLGFHPLAWVHITDRMPQDAVFAIQKAFELGYEGVVLFLGKALVTGNQLQPLNAALQETNITTEQLFIATPPLAHLPDQQALEVLAPICRGGWMPLCFPLWEKSAEQLIAQDVYQAISDLSLLWGTTPAIYPVLSPVQANHEDEPFLPEKMIPWVEEIIQRGVDFFSVYHVGMTEKSLWPILQSAGVPQQPEVAAPSETGPEPGIVVPQPVYVVVTANDTVWGLINRHGLTKEQFWNWNAHLWESRSLPRDPDYLQEGWRVRVK